MPIHYMADPKLEPVQNHVVPLLLLRSLTFYSRGLSADTREHPLQSDRPGGADTEGHGAKGEREVLG